MHFSNKRIWKIGFLMNPIAGMGGKVGLKGTDGSAYEKAIQLGAVPVAVNKTRLFSEKLKMELASLKKKVEIFTPKGQMGFPTISESIFKVSFIPFEPKTTTSAQDTIKVTQQLIEHNLDLLVFVGGDGTAKDIYMAIIDQDADIPGFIGVPAGVKMYSGIFAVTPEAAAEIVKLFIFGESDFSEFEIMDADEEQFRSDHFSIKLFGYLNGPYVPLKIQGGKQVSPDTENEIENQEGVARFTTELLNKKRIIIGPGTTTKMVASFLGRKKTLLGVDFLTEEGDYFDVNEQQILDNPFYNPKDVYIIVSPIGHQGIIFGRGNQQISSVILRDILQARKKDNIIVICTKSKLQSFEGGKLRVDTGDSVVDSMLKGYIKVISDYREWRIVEVI